MSTVLQIDRLPVAHADGDHLASVVHVNELLARRVLRLATEVIEEVVAIDVVLVGSTVEFHALEQLLLHIGRAGGGGERRQPVFVRHDAVERHPGREMPGPADEAWHAEGAFPVRVLLASEGRRAGIGPRVVVRAVVRRLLDDGVVRET